MVTHLSSREASALGVEVAELWQATREAARREVGRPVTGPSLNAW